MDPNIPQPKINTGVQRLKAAFGYSIAGYKTAWQTEASFRQELIVAAVASLIALVLPIVALEKLLLIGVLILVLMVELINSAIEAVVDRVSTERHPLSKNAKDFGSAAVLLALILAAATWALIGLPLLWR